MIYPNNIGKAGEIIRLNTLESVWVQGKLRMWGRWSFIGNGRTGNMFNQLLASSTVTKTSINEALRRMEKIGIGRSELQSFLRDMMLSNKKSHLAHCTDAEALIVDSVVGDVLKQQPQLIELLHNRYDGHGKSKRKIAENIHEKYPEWHYNTCRNRVDMWLNTAEYMIYRPLSDAFEFDSMRFQAITL